MSKKLASGGPQRPKRVLSQNLRQCVILSFYPDRVNPLMQHQPVPALVGKKE